jgi:hypothetical protein
MSHLLTELNQGGHTLQERYRQVNVRASFLIAIISSDITNASGSSTFAARGGHAEDLSRAYLHVEHHTS